MPMKFLLPSYNAKTDFIQYKVITHRCVDRKDVVLCKAGIIRKVTEL